MSALDLCVGIATYRPENAAIAQAEATRRGVDCTQHQAAVAAAIAAGHNAAARASQAFQPARQVNCTSTAMGGTVNTVCR